MNILQGIKQNRIQLFLLLLILAVHCYFVAAKEGYHMDELLSFELSNAEYNPWIVPNQPQGRLAKFVKEEIEGESFGESAGNVIEVLKDVLKNRGNSKLLSYKADVYEEPVWIDRDTFIAYETTGQRDQFNLLSVYFNVKDDNHPPVHFMLLHLISSLFPGRITVWMGCVINLVTLMGICICMMKTGILLEEEGVLTGGMGKTWGICGAVLYGLSAGSIATTLLIRMYGLVTFLCVLSFYLHLKKWLKDGFEKNNRLLILITVLGFLTQYFFLFYCILLAVVTFVLLMIRRRRKEAWTYVRSMLLAAIVGVGFFPFAISDVFSSARGKEALTNLGEGLFDYGNRLSIFGEMVLDRCFGSVVLGIVVLFPAIFYALRKLSCKGGENRALIWMLVLPPLGYFLLAAKVSPMYVDRYVMVVFPFVLLWVALLLSGVMTAFGRKSRILGAVAVMIFGVLSVWRYDGEYLYRGYEKQLEIAREHSKQACICLYEGSGYYDNLPEFMEYERTLLVKPVELKERQNRTDIESLDEVVLLLKQTVKEEECLELMSQYGFVVEEILLEQGVHNDKVYLMYKVGAR